MKFKDIKIQIKGDIGKLVVTHFIMAIFGLMVYLPIGAQTEKTKIISLAFGVLTLVFYYYLIDLHMWNIGAKDRIRTRANNEPFSAWKGFITGLYAAIPDFVLGVLYVVFWCYRSYKWAANPCYIFSLLTGTWEGMFLGIKASIVDFPWFFLITPFIAAGFAGFSYFCGSKEFTLIRRPETKNN